MKFRLALAMTAALTIPGAYAQSEKISPDDWPRLTRDYAGTRYSPLTQINTTNVSKLATAWTMKVRPEGGGSIVSSMG
jgi:glucose dehydrogenase